MATNLDKLFSDQKQLDSFLVRFSSKIERCDSGCHEWRGARTPKGYGVIGLGPRRGHVTLYAHRVSIWLVERTDRPNAVVLHSCDNPCCCNPAHLSYGTAGDNSADMVAKDRSARGERNPQAKLTEAEIPFIRRDRRSLSTIASCYGVDPKQIHRIKRRENWKHVA